MRAYASGDLAAHARYPKAEPDGLREVARLIGADSAVRGPAATAPEGSDARDPRERLTEYLLSLNHGGPSPILELIVSSHP